MCLVCAIFIVYLYIMKKILFTIFTLLFVWLGFCSAVPSYVYTDPNWLNAVGCVWQIDSNLINPDWYNLLQSITNASLWYCDSIVLYDCVGTSCSVSTDTIHTDIVVCGSVSISSSLTNSSSNMSYLKTFSNSLRWNITTPWGTAFPYNTYPCVYYASWTIPMIYSTTSISNLSNNVSFGYKIFSADNFKENFWFSYCWLSCPSQYTSLECQTEYNLIPVEDVNSNYCEVNNLCPALTWGAWTWVSWSALYINNIQYLWWPNIYVNIDEWLQWLYDNSDSNSFVIDVEGYNYDMEYLDDITTIQEFTPSSDDFTKLFTLFGPFSWLLVGLLFVILVFYFIKKLF